MPAVRRCRNWRGRRDSNPKRANARLEYSRCEQSRFVMPPRIKRAASGLQRHASGGGIESLAFRKTENRPFPHADKKSSDRRLPEIK